MTKVIVITSGKGGTGKTTTAINLGAALNYFGKDVLILDGNVSTPNVGLHFGSPEVSINLNHVLSDDAELYEAIYEHESGLKIIPASLSIKDSEKINFKNLKNLKKEIAKLSDYVIIDGAAGLGEEALSIIDMADDLIVVTNPEMPAVTDSLKAIKTAENTKKNILGVIVTRVKKDRVEMNSESVKEMLEVPVLGMIPEDIRIKKALNMKNAIIHTHPKSKPSRAYKEIAAKLANVDYDSNRDKENLLDKFFEKIRKKNK